GGVVGLGSRGGWFGEGFEGVGNSELAWVCDSNRAVLMSARRFPGAGVTTSFEELLNDESLDAIALATPLATHEDLVERALRADKHVLVAIALARTAERALALTELSRERSRCLLTAHALLLHPRPRMLKEGMG